MRTSGLYAWNVIVVGAAALAGASGCATQGGDARRFRSGGPAGAASRLLMNEDVDTVQPVAAQVFRRHFRVDAQASSPLVLVSRPLELTEHAQPRRVRDVLRPSPNRRRQVAELYLTQEGAHVRVRCRVRTQRLDTAERAAFVRERGDDRPTDTPIDRPGASSVSAREEWVEVGRDRNLEREILAAIQRELTATRPAN